MQKYFNLCTKLQCDYEKLMMKSFGEEDKVNKEFYVNCLAYFDALRKSSKSDDAFEDEYFFTLPAVSGSGLDY